MLHVINNFGGSTNNRNGHVSMMLTCFGWHGFVDEKSSWGELFDDWSALGQEHRLDVERESLNI